MSKTGPTFIERNQNLRPRYTVISPDDAPATFNTEVFPSQYLYFSKPQNINNPIDLQTGQRRPSGWSMIWKLTDTTYSGKLGYRYGETGIGGGSVEYSGLLPVGHNEVPYKPCPIDLVKQAETKALIKLKNAKVNLGVSFGERKEAAGMMLQNFGKVAKAYKNFKRGRFKEAARSLGLGWRDAPDRWLEYQYGWKPLLSDIYEATRDINAQDRESEFRTWYHVKARSKDQVRGVSDIATGFNGVVGRSYDQHQWDVKVRFDFKPKPDMGLFAELDEWGVVNPLEVAWELIPFSFVVDWAIPIGDYLSALSAAVPYDLRHGTLSTFTHAKRSSSLRRSSNACYVASGNAGSEIKVFYRYLYNTFPLPSIEAFTANRNPESDTVATRVANALSILSGAVK